MAAGGDVPDSDRATGTNSAGIRLGQFHQRAARCRTGRQGDPRGPCGWPAAGIPIAIKDLVEIEGEVAMGDSAAWRNRVAPHTATLMRRLMAAGMINLGKTHTVEFAYGGWGTNQRLGTPRNPWDASTHRTPGGSSSGSDVAVAARMAPRAIGTDTGGLVHIPAAWNGITGLKTTIGRISTFGVLVSSLTLDTPGPITRDVEDAAPLLAVLHGQDQHDQHTLDLTANRQAWTGSPPCTHLRSKGWWKAACCSSRCSIR
jgi:Asp-tRNA(Asn)/Glu-tRNA(Gln) amidotransferase A subunit family amidase